MEIYTMPKFSGKTTLLMEELKAKPYTVYITTSGMHAASLREQYEELSDRIYSVDSYLYCVNRGLIHPGAEILIDELQDVLYAVFNRTTHKATLTDYTPGGAVIDA